MEEEVRFKGGEVRFKPFEYIQMDTKDLSDIERYWPYMRGLGLPRYEHTARDVRTGSTWYAYAHTNGHDKCGYFWQLSSRSIRAVWVGHKGGNATDR